MSCSETEPDSGTTEVHRHARLLFRRAEELPRSSTVGVDEVASMTFTVEAPTALGLDHACPLRKDARTRTCDSRQIRSLGDGGLDRVVVPMPGCPQIRHSCSVSMW